jgi:hypothetical protein
MMKKISAVEKTNSEERWIGSNVMAGLVPAIYVFSFTALVRRGCPGHLA